MKARKPEKLLLTVGLIVKNEEKHLENCLSRVRRMLDTIPGEIIVADTGSTDRSVEIAEKYADEVFHFEWCDDFSAARNSVINKARGEWYLVLDADEYLDENFTELTDFLRSSSSKKYEMASVLVRNFRGDGSDKESYSDFRSSRIFRPSSGNRYVGKIHESLVITPPIKFLSVVLHHYGYVFDTMEKRVAKRERNLALILEELEQDPENLQFLVQAAESCFYNGDDVQYLERGIKVVRKNPNHSSARRCFYMLMVNYIQQNRMDEAVALGEECMELYKDEPEAVIMMDIYHLMIIAEVSLGNMKEVLAYYRKYEDLGQRVDKGEINQSDLLYAVLDSNTEANREQMRILAVSSALPLEDYDTAAYAMKYLDLERLEERRFTMAANTAFKLATKGGFVEGILPLYGAARKWTTTGEAEDKSKAKIFYLLLENFYLKNEELRPDLAKAFENSPIAWKNDHILALIRLDNSQEKPDFMQSLDHYIGEVWDWESEWPITYYLIMKYQRPLPKGAVLYNQARMSIVLGNLAATCKDFGQVLAAYDQTQVMEDLRAEHMLVMAYEKALIASKDWTDNLRLELVNSAGKRIWSYVERIYTPEVLNSDGVADLPPIYELGHALHFAEQCLATGDELGYVRHLRVALDHNRNVAPLVELVEFIIQAREREKKEQQKEFAQLMASFKEKAEQLIQLGMKAEARVILEKFLCLCPDDEDALRLWKQIDGEPGGIFS